MKAPKKELKVTHDVQGRPLTPEAAKAFTHLIQPGVWAAAVAKDNPSKKDVNK